MKQSVDGVILAAGRSCCSVCAAAASRTRAPALPLDGARRKS